MICVFCLLMGLAGVSVLVASAYFDSAKYSGLLDLISSIGSLLGGVAGTIAAIAAYIGVDAWKKQIKHGKHISLIWSCMESLRNFHRRYFQWYVYAYAYGTSQMDTASAMDVEKNLLDSSMEELSAHFSALDKIVVKNQWQWANYASMLAGSITSNVRVLREYREAPSGILQLSKSLELTNTQLQESIDFLEEELEKLESQYQ